VDSRLFQLEENGLKMKKIPQYFSHLLKYTLMPVLLAGVGFSGVYAQEEYRTSAGTLIITAFLDDKPVKISSRKLLILLDYETGKVVIKQKMSTLTSDNDTIQGKLESKTDEEIRFEGKLGLDYINTRGHPPLDFQVEGIIYPQNYHVIGSGHLVHRVHGTSSTCLLSMNFQLDIDELFPDNQLPELGKEVYIQVVQSLLGRVNER